MTISNTQSVTIVYVGEINRYGYERISKVCEGLPEDHPKTVDLVLSTYGGDPDAGFRIARCLQHYFEDGITLYVPHYCKSAGTLIAIGASELVLSDGGELGPLDVQIMKSDEMFERSSGMDITQGFNVLSTQAYDMFNSIAIKLKTQTRLSTKLATDAAAQITVGTFSPIFSQIDPTRLGETQRATEIAFKYGNRLQEKFNNLHENGVLNLVADYPSHGFVIDRKEARSIFKKVRAPDSTEKTLLNQIDVIIREGISLHDVFCNELDLPALYETLNRKEEDDEANRDNNSEQQANASTAQSNDISNSPELKKCNARGQSKKQRNSDESNGDS